MAAKESLAAPSSNRPPMPNSKTTRLPAPSLFVGPPSRNASQLSVVRAGGSSATHTTGASANPNNNNTSPTDNSNTTKPTNLRTEALTRQRSHRQYSPNSAEGAAGEGGLPETTAAGNPIYNVSKPTERQLDSRYREVQNTLDEVELTAQSSTHVFGTTHARALDELRAAQIELARAWGRGNAGILEMAGRQQQQQQKESGEGGGGQGDVVQQRFSGAEDIAGERKRASGRTRTDTETSASTTLSGESGFSGEGSPQSGGRGGGARERAGTNESGKSHLEEETKEDIRLASERRAANEAYFKKVDEGVKDVVARLAVVAEAMRGVEEESRSLWSGSSERSGSG